MTYDIRAISDFKIQFSLNLAHKIFRNDTLVGLNYRLFALLNDCLTLPFFDPLHGITHCLENGLDIFLLICIKL